MGHALAQGQRNQEQPEFQAVPKILVLLKSGTDWFHTGSG